MAKTSTDALGDSIAKLKDQNFNQFASASEKRTKEMLSSLDSLGKQVGKDNQAYMDAITDAIKASGKLSGTQLKGSLQGIKDIENVLKAQTDMAGADRQVLLQAADIAKSQINSKSQNKILGKIQQTISDNAVDITSIVGGLAGNSPAIMFATKYILDKRKAAKEDNKARKQAAAEESLERLTSLQSAKQDKKNSEKQAEVLKTTANSSSSSASDSMDGGQLSELVIWNELQADELEKIRNGIDRSLGFETKKGADDEENRREQNRTNEKIIDALEDVGSAVAVGGAGGAGGGGGGDQGGGILATVGGLIAGKAGLSAVVAGLKTALGSGGPLATTIGRLASAAAPIAAVAVGGGMIAKDVYDMASAALDKDITTEIEGKDMGGVIGGALLGTVGMFVAGPLGAGLGMALGNMVGSFVGDTVAPNYQEVFNESKEKIVSSKVALSTSLGTLTKMFEEGVLTTEEFETQKAAIESQQALNDQYAAEAVEVDKINQLRLKKGQQYNDLQATITSMEEQGIEVSSAMYDTLLSLETEYDSASDAFEEAANNLQAKVDPNWYDSLSATMQETWGMLSDAATLAWGTMTAGFESARAWFGEQLASIDEQFGVTEKIEAAKEKAGEIIDDASALVALGAEKVGETFNDGVQALGLEDEVAYVAEQLDAAGEAVQEVGQEISDAIGGMAEGVTGWFSSWWGDDAELPRAADRAAGLLPGSATPYTPRPVATGDAATRKNALVNQLDQQGITDPQERAAIMAQADHESGGFTNTEENFNYSGKRLFELYGQGNSYGNRVRFGSQQEAEGLVSQGKSAVGDVIYGGRMGNDQEGDGFKYRGRGAFQLTGKANYKKYGDMIGVDLVSNPELVNDPDIGAKIAVEYYKDRVSGRGIEAGDVRAVSRAVNGGTVGLADRSNLYSQYLAEGVPAAEMIPGDGGSGTALAQIAATNEELLAEQQGSGGSGSPVIMNSSNSTVATSNSSTNNASTSTQFLTPEEAQMMYG